MCLGKSGKEGFLSVCCFKGSLTTLPSWDDSSPKLQPASSHLLAGDCPGKPLLKPLFLSNCLTLKQFSSTQCCLKAHLWERLQLSYDSMARIEPPLQDRTQICSWARGNFIINRGKPVLGWDTGGQKWGVGSASQTSGTSHQDLQKGFPSLPQA